MFIYLKLCHLICLFLATSELLRFISQEIKGQFHFWNTSSLCCVFITRVYSLTSGLRTGCIADILEKELTHVLMVVTCDSCEIRKSWANLREFNSAIAHAGSLSLVVGHLMELRCHCWVFQMSALQPLHRDHTACLDLPIKKIILIKISER